MQAQTEPKLHPETANMEFEQVITKRSAALKFNLKFNLQPKWFLRGGSCKFHVSDFRATLFFTSFHFVLRSRRSQYHALKLGGAIAIPVKHSTRMHPANYVEINWKFSLSPATEWLMTPGTGWPSRNCWLSTKLFTYQVQGVPI